MRKSQGESYAHLIAELKELLSGAAIRALAGIVDTGETLLAKIGNPDGGDPDNVHDKKRDVWTWFRDALTGASEQGRLYIPASILFNKPNKGETAHVLRARKAGGPGSALVVPDGSDGKTDDFVPPWYGDENCGIYSTDRVVRIQSKNKDVLIEAGGAVIKIDQNGKIEVNSKTPSQDIVFNGGAAKVARVGDSTAGHLHAAGTLIAGPFAVTGSTALATDTMNQGANNVKA